jgi:hypothetical protein
VKNINDAVPPYVDRMYSAWEIFVLSWDCRNASPTYICLVVGDPRTVVQKGRLQSAAERQVLL